ncbi:MAG: hypothetical protein KC431_19830 [Myxococcales bacterium]|nr:hypothetical protein [Myxococcales bacterium]
MLDGYSRVHWELRESMTEADVELVIQHARELVPSLRSSPTTGRNSSLATSASSSASAV